MEKQAEKLHLMISSAISQQTTTVEAYEKTVSRYDFPAIKSMRDAIENDSPSIATIKKQLAKRDGGKVNVISDILKLMFAKTARAFNIARNIEPAQIVDLVQTIESEFYFLKLSEVYLILKNAKMGKYGKLYERIDEPTILGWFNEYVEERVVHFERQTTLKHDQATSHEKGRSYDNFVSNLYMNNQKAEEDRVRNIAYAMAKKMNANNNNQQGAQVQPQQDQPTTPPDNDGK